MDNQLRAAEAEADKEDQKVVLSALKLMELISICNLDEFYIHQWLFMFDYPGISIRNSLDVKKDEKMQTVGPFRFVPYGVCRMPTNNYIDYTIDENRSPSENTCQTPKRKLIVTENKVNNDEDLREKTKELFDYLIYLNETRVTVDLKEVESLIEQDFIGMDDYLK